MKRIISLVSFIIAMALSLQAETVNYYVSTTGSDANDGLSSENALATVDSAIAYIHDDFAGGTNNDFTINFGEGTFEAANIAIANGSQAFSLSLVGEAADKTTLTSYIDSAGVIPNAYLFTKLVAENTNLSLSIKNLKVSNYGFNTGSKNHGGIFWNCTDNNLPAAEGEVNLSIDGCIIEDIVSNNGAICRSNKAGTVFTMTNTYLNHITTLCHNNRFHSPLYFYDGAKATIENCVFNNFVKDHNNQNQQVNAAHPAIILGAQTRNGTAATEVTFVNNTIINDSIINTSKLKKDDCMVKFQSSDDGQNNDPAIAPTFSFANNLIISEVKTYEGAAVDGLTTRTRTTVLTFASDGCPEITWTNTSNNIFQTNSGLEETGNTINDAMTYGSTEIAFEMDGFLPKVLTADNGLMYVKATGAAVAGMGLATVAPETDITGTTRSTTAPWIGAYEEGETSALQSTESAQISLYPNPATDVIYVKGDIAQLAIYSLTGQSMGTFPIVNKQVNVSNLSQGIYLVNSMDANGLSIETTQLVKK